MNLTTQLAQSRDIPLINDVLYHSFGHWGYSDYDLQRIMAVYAITDSYISKSVFNLVYDKDELVGFFSFSKDNQGLDEVDYFIISRQLIGSGYGHKMWQLCCEMAKSCGMKEFRLKSNPYAADFYRRMGAIEIGTQPSKIFEGTVLPIMRYSLA